MTLALLAAAHGVATSYDDWSGRLVEVPVEAVVAALAALDVDAAGDDAVAAALAEVEEAPWRSALPPSLVLPHGPGQVQVYVPAGSPPHLEVLCEDGRRLVVDGTPVELARRDGLVRLELPLPDLPLGWHRLVLGQESCGLVVVPERLPALPDRHWGWQVQLYALRSAGSWAVGDYADLRTVVDSAAADGAGAVLVNPLHAESPVLPVQPSPYSPSSRLFRSPLGLRLEQVPEADGIDLSDLRPATDLERVDRDAAWSAKLAALERLWPHHRTGALAAWRAERGEALELFARFCALAEVYGVPWQEWPEELRDPGSTTPAADPERVSFWCWVQLLVDEQLVGTGEGMAVGVIHDLAVGVDAGGADAWAMQDALALGTTIGAPPDSFNQKGQDWGLPPWRPDRLRALGYEPLGEMVRGVLRHAGGLRVDHVMGLSRLWWVPAGRTADQGTYVSYNADAMLGVLALEASRAGAVVIGEDLGTVEPSVRELLDRTGILGSAVLWFQTEQDGTFVPPARWRSEALASVTTHDLPTAAGLLAEEHVWVRAELDLLGHSVEVEQARVRAERTALLAMLTEQGLLTGTGDPVLAMHAALVASPCRIVLAAYGDAVGDLRQPNLPGTVDEYPDWRLPVADGQGRPLSLEQLLAAPGVRRLTALLQQVR